MLKINFAWTNNEHTHSCQTSIWCGFHPLEKDFLCTVSVSPACERLVAASAAPSTADCRLRFAEFVRIRSTDPPKSKVIGNRDKERLELMDSRARDLHARVIGGRNLLALPSGQIFAQPLISLGKKRKPLCFLHHTYF